MQHQQAVLEDKDGKVDQNIKTGSTFPFARNQIQLKTTCLCKSDVYLESPLASRLPYVFEGLVVLEEVLATSNIHLEERKRETLVTAERSHGQKLKKNLIYHKVCLCKLHLRRVTVHHVGVFLRKGEIKLHTT